MVQWNEIDIERWPAMHERLDAKIADAVTRRLLQLTSRPVPSTLQWTKELDELRLRREPDYDSPGLAVAYAIRYMARRAVSVLGGLTLIRGAVAPTAFVDFGSGTGAAFLALDLLPVAGQRSILGIEPSGEMRALAGCLALSPNTAAHQREGSFTDLIVAPDAVVGAQVILFSACFPYRFDRWEEIGARLGDHQESTSPVVLAIEPEAKVDGLQRLGASLPKRGWPTRLVSSRDLPPALTRDDLPLNQLTRVWRRLGSPGGRHPASWWTPPTDFYLIANPNLGCPRPAAAGKREVLKAKH